MSSAFLYLGESTAAPVGWMLKDGGGGRGDLAAAAGAVSGRQCVAFAPGPRLLMTRAPVPSRSRAQQARAVPYVLEEELASDVDLLHFALGHHRDGEVVVCVVERAWLQAWLEALEEAGISLGALVPDLLAVPWDGVRWSLLPRGETVLVRTGAQSGFAADPGTLTTLLTAALAEAEDDGPERLRVLATPGNTGLPAALPLPHDLETPAQEELAWLAQGHQPATALNLLQGEFAPSTEGENPWRPWRPAAAMGLLWLAVAGGLQVAEYLRLRDQDAVLQQQVSQLYQQLFPNARSVVRPRLRTERLLAELRAGEGDSSGFLKLLGAAAGPLAATPGAELQGLSYRGGALFLDLRVPALQTLDRLKQAIGDGGAVAVTVQTATARDTGVQSRLQLTEGGA